jgi:hypothetical protein
LGQQFFEVVAGVERTEFRIRFELGDTGRVLEMPSYPRSIKQVDCATGKVIYERVTSFLG